MRYHPAVHETLATLARTDARRTAGLSVLIIRPQGADWDTLVWLVMVTGMRRAEVLTLRWAHVDRQRALLLAMA